MISATLLLSSFFIAASNSSDESGVFVIGAAVFLAGPIFYAITYRRYRNQGERHYHEKETPVTMDNLMVYDNYLKREKGKRSKMIPGANSTEVTGTLFKQAGKKGITEKMADSLIEELKPK